MGVLPETGWLQWQLEGGGVKVADLKIGDLVTPDKDAFKQASWNPQGELRVVAIKRGNRSGLTMIKAKDERGYSYTGIEGCFEKVRKKGSK